MFGVPFEEALSTSVLLMAEIFNDMSRAAKRTAVLPSGRSIPVLGQGTWRMGEDPSRRELEIAALRLGLDLGMTLIDTAEMYAEGATEKLVGEAIAGRRAEVFLVTKVYPHNAGRRRAIDACARSLRRLKTDYIDLYLLHWRDETPLAETFEAFEELKQSGKIGEYGVSNFDVDDLEEAYALPGGNGVATNQVLYNLAHRGIDWDLIRWCRQRRIPIMAYSPLANEPTEQKRIFGHPIVRLIASRHAATPAQVALAWVFRQPDIVAIPKAAQPVHIRENRSALEIELTERDITELDKVFPAPDRKVPLEMI